MRWQKWEGERESEREWITNKVTQRARQRERESLGNLVKVGRVLLWSPIQRQFAAGSAFVFFRAHVFPRALSTATHDFRETERREIYIFDESESYSHNLYLGIYFRFLNKVVFRIPVEKSIKVPRFWPYAFLREMIVSSRNLASNRE